MDKNTIYSEILYLGFVYEKGRVYNKKFSFTYKNFFQIQIKMWEQIIVMMSQNGLSEVDYKFYNEFLKLCDSNKEMKKIYSYAYEKVKRIEKENNFGISSTRNLGDEAEQLLKILNELINELLTLVSQTKLIIPGKKIFVRLNALHNIPRYFVNVPQDSRILNKIDYNTTVEYCFSNMDNELRSKYSYLLKLT
jgi:hypothetical protein